MSDIEIVIIIFSRHMITRQALTMHLKSKNHRQRVKKLKDAPFTMKGKGEKTIKIQFYLIKFIQKNLEHRNVVLFLPSLI